MYMCVCIYIYIYVYVINTSGLLEPVLSWSRAPQLRVDWVFIKGGCSGRGVQWMGVVLYNQLVYKQML